MSKDKILRTTVNLYAHYGIKGVSMSQIAGALQISKKTLYAEFGNKEDLLSACIDSELQRINRVLDNTERDAINPIDTIILLTSDLMQYRSYFCPAFYRDLGRFHEAFRKMEHFKIKLADRYYHHFEKGRDEGYFQPEFDYEAMASIFLEQLSDRNPSHQSVVIFTFLRGICTDKGTKALCNYSPGTIRKNVYDYN